MKKIHCLVLVCLLVSSMTIHANTDTTESQQPLLEQAKASAGDYDPALVINLQDEQHRIVQTVHPAANGDFNFTGLIDAAYSIKVYNPNGIQSESYKVNVSNGEIKANLQTVLVPDNLLPTGACFDGCSSNSESELKLCVTPSELKERGNVEFTVSKTALVHIVISNTTGDNFAILPIGEVDSGIHTVNFDASNMKGDYNISAFVGKSTSTCKVNVR